MTNGLEGRGGMDFRGINDTYRYLAGVRGTKYQVQGGGDGKKDRSCVAGSGGGR